MGVAAKITLLSVAGIGLLVCGIFIGKSDVGFPSAGAGSAKGGQGGGFKLLAEIPRSASSQHSNILENVGMLVAPSVPPVVNTAKKVVASVAEVVTPEKGLQAAATTSSSSVAIAQLVKIEKGEPAAECHFVTDTFAKYEPFFISEVAWMGTPEDSGNEWIEIKNASSSAVDIGGYWLLDKAEQIKVHFPSFVVEPGGFYLLERGDDVVPSTTADYIYTGALSNSNEGLRLFDPWCDLVDQALAEPSWPAGNSTSKKSMERGGNWTWYTFNGTTTADNILGTPKKANTAPDSPIAQDTAPASTPAPAPPSPEPAAAPEPEPVAETVVVSTKLVISLIQITGGSGKTTEDFVEFYNPGPGEFNLKGHRLVKRTKTGTSDTSLKSWTEDAIIPQGGLYRWANSSYPGNADARTSGSIADDNAVALRKGAEDTGEIIDAVGWGQAANSLVEGSVFGTNPKVNELLVRKNNQDTDNNAADFEIR